VINPKGKFEAEEDLNVIVDEENQLNYE